MPSYAAASVLRGMILEILHTHVSSVIDLRIERLPGPFRPCNWKVEWLNVLAEDYGRARDKADDARVGGAVWVSPDLRARIAYRGVTASGELRHASFKKEE